MSEEDAFLRLSKEDQKRIRWAVLQLERMDTPELRAGMVKFVRTWRRQSLVLTLVVFPLFGSALLFVLDSTSGEGSVFRSQPILIAIIPLCVLSAIGVVWSGRQLERANL
jgi:hypothetical protein